MPEYLAFESLIAHDGSRIGIQRWMRTEAAIVFDRILTSPETYTVHIEVEMKGKRWVRCSFTEHLDGQATSTNVEADGLIEDEDLIPTTLEYFMVRDANEHLVNGEDDSSVEHEVSHNHPSFHYHVFEEHDPHALSQEGTIYQLEEGTWEVEREGDFAATYRFTGNTLTSITYPWAHAQPLSESEGRQAWEALGK